MKFSDFPFEDNLLAGLRDIKFEQPTPIQVKSIPIVLEGKDLIGVAQTGTGKTGAFVIPIMQQVLKSDRKGVKALILTPTRELATQIDEQIFAIGYHAGITSATVIGGSDFSVQAKALKAGVDIIVATPGRLIDQNKVVGIDFSSLGFLVLDEADRMMDMGFMPDMKKIISWLPQKRQTLLFSATMPPEIKKLSSSIMQNPESVEIERSKPNESVEQRSYFLRSNQKIPLVKGIFDELEWDSCIIFTSTKKGTDELQRLLKKEGIKAASIHGDRSQDDRNKALSAFKNNEIPVIVATDVLARGIDIKGVSIIINYDVPNSSDDYVHRIGRTGRYDRSGIAITFVTRRDSRSFRYIEEIKGNKITSIQVPEEFKNHKEFSWTEHFKVSDKKSSDNERQSKTKETGSKTKTSSQSASDTKTVKKQKGRHKSDPSGKKASPKKSEDRRTQRADLVEESVTPSHKGSTESRKKESSSTDSKSISQTEERVVLPPVIEKAVTRNKDARKPAKGVWGIVKSLIPKF